MAKSSASSNNTGKICLMLSIISLVLGGLLVYLFLGSNTAVRCDGFKEPSFQGICYTNLAIDQKDVSICAKVAGLASVNGCYKEVAIAAKDALICAKIDDGLLLDSCYNRVGALTNDKSVCDKIKDVSLRNGCYSEIGIGNQTTPPKNQTPTTNPPVQNNTPPSANQPTKNYRNQNISIVSVYLSGSYLFFQIRAPFANSLSLDTKDVTFLIENTSYQIGPWSGGVNGPMCFSMLQINPGQNCFGRIENATCLMGDRFKLTLPGGFVEKKEIGGCNFR